MISERNDSPLLKSIGVILTLAAVMQWCACEDPSIASLEPEASFRRCSQVSDHDYHIMSETLEP